MIEGHWRIVRMLARERKQLIMGAIRGRSSAQRGRSGFRPFWKTLMVQNRPHYRDIISIHTLSELMGALLGKIRFLSSVNIPHGRTDFLSSGRNRRSTASWEQSKGLLMANDVWKEIVAFYVRSCQSIKVRL